MTKNSSFYWIGALVMLAGCDTQPTADGAKSGRDQPVPKAVASGVDENGEAPNGVDSPEADQSQDASETSATAKASSSASSSKSGSATWNEATDTRAGGARAVTEKSELYNFEFSYPKEAGAIPALQRRLDSHLDKRRASLKADAMAARKEAGDDGFPYNAYSTELTWEKSAEIPGWLSLSMTEWTYEGGAHGNSYFDTLLWDKAKNKAVKPTDLFTSPAALTKALREPFCAALDRERGKKLGSSAAAKDGPFSDCIDPLKEPALVLASRNGRKFDRLVFLIPPYAAGSYAEGDYKVTLPVTQAILNALKPEYAGIFSKGR